jgi:hypothetical protein
LISKKIDYKVAIKSKQFLNKIHKE